MEKKIRWGIMGPGRIAHKFVQSLQCLKDAEIAAVGSRSIERAAEFAAQYGINRSYGSYQDFVADPDIITKNPSRSMPRRLQLSSARLENQGSS